MFIGELVRPAVERGGGTGIGNPAAMGEKVFNYFECWKGDGEINLSAIICNLGSTIFAETVELNHRQMMTS